MHLTIDINIIRKDSSRYTLIELILRQVFVF